MPGLDERIRQAEARGDLERKVLLRDAQATLGTISRVDMLAAFLGDPLLNGFKEKFDCDPNDQAGVELLAADLRAFGRPTCV